MLTLHPLRRALWRSWTFLSHLGGPLILFILSPLSSSGAHSLLEPQSSSSTALLKGRHLHAGSPTLGESPEDSAEVVLLSTALAVLTCTHASNPFLHLEQQPAGSNSLLRSHPVYGDCSHLTQLKAGLKMLHRLRTSLPMSTKGA